MDYPAQRTALGRLVDHIQCHRLDHRPDHASRRLPYRDNGRNSYWPSACVTVAPSWPHTLPHIRKCFEVFTYLLHTNTDEHRCFEKNLGQRMASPLESRDF